MSNKLGNIYGRYEFDCSNKCSDYIDDLSKMTEDEYRNLFEDDVYDDNKQDTTKMCPSCSSYDLIDDIINGNVVCSSCGQVCDIIMDDNPEWKQYDDDDKNDSRCSMPINPLLPISSLGTTISGPCYGRVRMLQTWDSMPYRERSHNLVYKKIQDICKRGNMVKCIEDDAKIMYKIISDHIKTDKKKTFNNTVSSTEEKKVQEDPIVKKRTHNGQYIIIRGKNRNNLINACVFFSCRKNGKTRTVKEIAEISGSKFTDVTKGCKNFLKLIKTGTNPNAAYMSSNTNTSMPKHFITRYSNELKLDQSHIEQALTISENIKKLNLASSHTPCSIALSCILLVVYINDIKHITKKKIAEKFDISDVTLTKTYNKIENYRYILIDNDLTNAVLENIKQETNDDIPENIKKKMEMYGDNDDDMFCTKKESDKYKDKDKDTKSALVEIHDEHNEYNEYENHYKNQYKNQYENEHNHEHNHNHNHEHNHNHNHEHNHEYNHECNYELRILNDECFDVVNILDECNNMHNIITNIINNIIACKLAHF